jgi:hypothetical protein
MATADLTGTGLLTGLTAAHPKDNPAKIKAAATQFEALLIGQMLKSMHDTEGGWLGTGDDIATAPSICS